MMLRILATVCVLFASALGARAADRIVTTTGDSYTRAADGHYYPSAHVRADASVSNVPATSSAPTVFRSLPIVAPAVQQFAPASPCAGGNCPVPTQQRRGLFR